MRPRRRRDGGRRRARLRASVLFSVGGVIFGPTAGFAQERPSLDLRTWRPPIDPLAGLVSEPVTSPGSWRWNVALWGHYAQSPVVLRDAATGVIASRPLEQALAADVVASIGIGDRTTIGFDVPVLVWQDGSSSLPASVVTRGQVIASGLGDAAISAKATIVSNDRQGVHGGFGLAALGVVGVPTGDQASFAAEGSATTSLRFLGEYALGVAALRATLGYKLRFDHRPFPASGPAPLVFGDEIPWAVGLSLRPKALGAGIDADDRQTWEIALHGSLPAGPVAPFGLGGPGASNQSPVLLAVDDRIALGSLRDAYVVWGADFGLDDAAGVPAVRVVFAMGWAPRPHDRDSDGVPDERDECPDLPEDRDGIQDADGCPEDDADGDGVPDSNDACPLVSGVASDDPSRNGCPPGTAGRDPQPGSTH